ncbi:MAG: ABC transporter ATP-binding protein [Planctomycetota bacterium]|jgi:putative ABC transport system ATP-binding protein|nr:ABC transporter ATP-binding protein [Planctomycetota bacterium]
MGILEFHDVGMDYGQVKALQHVDLAVESGEWLSIMGPSGSGKTTLMNIIGCMDRATSGRVVLDGEDLSKLGSRGLTAIRRDKVGLIFQQFHLAAYLTALENVVLAQYYHSLPDRDEALAALDRVGLADRARHLPGQLSGGEQQRVCIARALINHPKILLADEPTGNLDEANEKLVMDILRRLHAEGGTIVTVTHSRAVGRQADRILMLEHGRVARTVPGGEHQHQHHHRHHPLAGDPPPAEG